MSKVSYLLNLENSKVKFFGGKLSNIEILHKKISFIFFFNFAHDLNSMKNKTYGLITSF